MNEEGLFRLFGASMLAVTVSIVMAIIISFFLPIAINEVDPNEIYERDRHRVFTLEELEQATREMREEIAREEFASDAFFQAEKKRAIWVSWLPWFLLPFLFKSIKFKAIAVVMVVPIVLLVPGLVLPVEIITFFIAMLLGTVFREKVRQKRARVDRC